METTFRVVVSDEDQSVRKGNEFFRILKYVRNKVLIVVSFTFAVLNGIMPVLSSVLLGDMVDVMADSDTFLDEFKKIILKLIYFYIGMMVIESTAYFTKFYTSAELLKDIRRETYKKYMNLGVNYFDKCPTGIMIGRLSQDATLIHDIYVDKLFQALNMGFQSVSGIILSFIKCWRVALPAVCFIIISVMIYIIGNKLIDKIWIVYNESSSAAANKAEEVISSFRTIKSFDNELYESGLYNKDLKSVNEVFKKTSIAQGIKDGLIALVSHLMLSFIIYYGCYLIIKKPYLGYQSGSIFIMFMSLIMAVFGLSQAFSIADDMNKASISAAKILEILETKPDKDRKEGKEMGKVKGKIEFRDVCFKYESASTYAINHLSFTINPGETVAFVGESGCGKSTTLQLIERFYEIQSGKILIDDQDISQFSAVSLRSNISIVPQSPVLYSMTILDNIRYSKPKATKKEVVESAKIGNAHNFIMTFPEKYMYKAHQTSLSGGQKQRICISRAILANTPILLLDEATAALDTESEKLVQDSLEKFRKGKTAILVAHRLATVKNADRIFVFQNGRIIEEGNHEQLLAKGGFYADLVKFQLQ